MKTSVVILNWNGRRLLERFLPQVVANTPANLAEIIVADNGSTDDSVDYVKRMFPQVKIIQFEENYGFAEGYNRALALVDTPYVVLLNSDVAPMPGWLHPLVDRLDTQPLTAACQPKILSIDNPGQFEYAGASGGYLDRHGYPYCRGRILSTVEYDHGQYDDIVKIDWASGAAMMIRRELYLEAGGLDPRFFAHMEEIDLCWRFRLMGYNIEVVPASIVRHLGGGSLPSDNPQKTYLNFRNNLLLLWKNLPAAKRKIALTTRRLLDTLAWGMFVATAKWKHAAAILRAHRDYRRMKREYPDATAHPDLLKNAPDIIWRYYVKRKKTFD